MKLKSILFLSAFCISTLACSQDSEDSITPNEGNPVTFGKAEDLGKLKDNSINEASGIEQSTIGEALIWVHNDSGNKPQLFLINKNGETESTFFVKGIKNRDWEDITLGPGPQDNTSYLYLAEIGDNDFKYDIKYIYCMPEPKHYSTADTIEDVTSIAFRYPQKTQNAEALMIDPLTKDLYIIAKNLDDPAIYRLAYAETQNDDTITLERLSILNIPSKGPTDLITAADISSDGLEVLVKTYGFIYYWKRKDSQTSIAELLQTTPEIIPYNPEPQGEAITFGKNDSGFYTLSEKRFGITPRLFFYARSKN
ncbi:hypothetical protein PZB74_00280 [Porifericola rhodea]|uniref:hypothetical protein n=1 Tax=Porifericola rhodea TaxID=930972 RepID=UPI0026661793|nr:hypothetical protein [Porifericola rhodea]WKN31794.1 hypothetical protein PZB74_00280 [Porifericola rhodea]